MKIQFNEVLDDDTKSTICRNIISKLPLWFGIPQSNDEYCEEVKKYSFIKICNYNDVIGFISLKQNFENVAEIYVMGILSEYHRKGIGQKLLRHLESILKKQNIRYLEVKTLGESRESEEYHCTRMFYEKVGFIPIDVLNNEWGKENPCLIMIKKI